MVEKDPEQRRCSAKKWSCEVVGSQLLSVFSTWSSSVLGKMEDALSWALIIDLTCHGQWHTSQVRWQPPCSGSFARLIQPSWSYQIAVVPPSKLQWHGANNVLPSCGGHLERWAQIFTAKVAAQESKLWDSYHGREGSWTEEMQSTKVEAAKL